MLNDADNCLIVNLLVFGAFFVEKAFKKPRLKFIYVSLTSQPQKGIIKVGKNCLHEGKQEVI